MYIYIFVLYQVLSRGGGMLRKHVKQTCIISGTFAKAFTPAPNVTAGNKVRITIESLYKEEIRKSLQRYLRYV